MALFLVQHGISLPKDKDPEQGLAPKGIEDAKRIADVAKGYGVKVSLIRHSVKKRARQTAEIFADALKPDQGIMETEGLKPLDDPIIFSQNINNADNLMIVGHLPFMEKLAAYLVTGLIDKSVFQFQNAGIVCFDEYADTSVQTLSWIIKWALMPQIGLTDSK